jgi:hypothetical protein
MSITRRVCAVILAAALGCCGCAQARYVRVDDAGGVVAVPANTDAWPFYYRSSAEALMKEKCPEGYVIDHEEEAAVGTQITERTASDTSSVSAYLLGAQVQTTESRDITEWRIAFHSRNSVPPVSPPPPGDSTPLSAN